MHPKFKKVWIYYRGAEYSKSVLSIWAKEGSTSLAQQWSSITRFQEIVIEQVTRDLTLSSIEKIREIVRCFKLGVLIYSYLHKLARGAQLVSFLSFFFRRSHLICYSRYFQRWGTPKHRSVPQNGSMLCHAFLCPPPFSELYIYESWSLENNDGMKTEVLLGTL